jgi:hypothetical protein
MLLGSTTTARLLASTTTPPGVGHAFKRYSNGTAIALNYPAAAETYAYASTTRVRLWAGIEAIAAVSLEARIHLQQRSMDVTELSQQQNRNNAARYL